MFSILLFISLTYVAMQRKCFKSYWQRILVKPQCYISLPKLPSHSKSILPLFWKANIDCITFSYNLIFEFRHLFPKLEAALELNWFNLIFNELLKYFTDPYLFWQIKKMMRGRIDLQNLYERNICHSSCAHKMMFKKWYDIKLFFLVILLLFTLLSLMCITI